MSVEPEVTVEYAPDGRVRMGTRRMVEGRVCEPTWLVLDSQGRYANECQVCSATLTSELVHEHFTTEHPEAAA